MAVKLSDKGNIEVVLQRVIFSSDSEVTLSFIVDKDGRHTNLKWAVASSGTSFKPVVFVNNSKSAEDEFRRRCGDLALSGKRVVQNTVYGEVKGKIFNDPINRAGFRVRNKSESNETQILEPGELE